MIKDNFDFFNLYLDMKATFNNQPISDEELRDLVSRRWQLYEHSDLPLKSNKAMTFWHDRSRYVTVSYSPVLKNIRYYTGGELTGVRYDLSLYDFKFHFSKDS